MGTKSKVHRIVFIKLFKFSITFLNFRQAFRNIFDLLRPERGGDCLLIFLTKHPLYDVYKAISKTEKWSKYMYDVDSIIGRQHYAPDPKSDLTQLLIEAGFVDYSVDVRSMEYVFDSFEVFKGKKFTKYIFNKSLLYTSMFFFLLANTRAINPFLKRISASLQDQFMDDIMSEFCKVIGLNNDGVHCFDKYPMPYQLAIIYARKPRS